MVKKVKVFYDGKCNLCSKEINYYKKITPKNLIMWIDITKQKKLLKEENINIIDGLKVLHVKDKNGQMHRGISSFIVIWKNLEGWGWKFFSFIVALPIVYQLLNILYFLFANWRFHRLEHCRVEMHEYEKKNTKDKKIK